MKKETIANALVHRILDTDEYTKAVMYQDRIEIVSMMLTVRMMVGNIWSK